MCKSTTKGGRVLPNFILYCWALTIIPFIFWLDPSVSLPKWLQMEQENCHPYSVAQQYWLDTLIYKHNPIEHNLIRTWKQIKSHFNIIPYFLLYPLQRIPLSPHLIWINPSAHGLILGNTLYSTYSIFWRHICHFCTLTKEIQFPKQLLFWYLQIWNYIRKHFIWNWKTINRIINNRKVPENAPLSWKIDLPFIWHFITSPFPERFKTKMKSVFKYQKSYGRKVWKMCTNSQITQNTVLYNLR